MNRTISGRSCGLRCRRWRVSHRRGGVPDFRRSMGLLILTRLFLGVSFGAALARPGHPAAAGPGAGAPTLRIRARRTASRGQRHQHQGGGDGQGDNAPVGLVRHRHALHGLPIDVRGPRPMQPGNPGARPTIGPRLTMAQGILRAIITPADIRTTPGCAAMSQNYRRFVTDFSPGRAECHNPAAEIAVRTASARAAACPRCPNGVDSHTVGPAWVSIPPPRRSGAMHCPRR